jgi:hypothetical protein
MKRLELTDASTGLIAIFPTDYFVFVKPKLTLAKIDDNQSKWVKVISIFNPMVSFEVKESYEAITKALKGDQS